MEDYRSSSCWSDDDIEHAACRASYVGVPLDEVFCGCRCHSMVTWRVRPDAEISEPNWGAL
jgi:hypothetical protein